MEKAEVYAKEKHKYQKYGDKPYYFHLSSVVDILKTFGIFDCELLCAGWLHDTIEDADTTKEDLELLFGKRIASIVDAVTDGEGESRKLRHAHPYYMIPLIPDSIYIKLADRIANVEHCIHSENFSLLKMYRKEYAEFSKMLRREGEAIDMWKYLDKLLKH